MVQKPTKSRPLLGRVDQTRRRLLLSGTAAGFALIVPGLARHGSAAEPVQGGTLRFTVLDGNPGNSLDPAVVTTWADNIIHSLMFDPLFTVGANGQPEPVLVESAEADPSAKTWTFKLRDAKWHDGKPITADDLAFTLKRIVDPAAPKSGAAGLATLDTDSFKKIDERTLQFSFKEPFAILPDVLSTFYFYRLVPEGFDPSRPIGSGPFKFKEFTPGQFGAFVRFDDYWGGKPYLDQVNYVGLNDATAALNAVRRGELDAFPLAPFSIAKQFQNGDPAVKVLATKPAQTMAVTMRVDRPPFDDVRVRTALKLLVNRQQMAQVVAAGFGEPAEDLFAHLDPDYPSELRRPHDIEQAKALLKEAGHENLTVDLTAYQGTAGMLEFAQVFAQNAREAGVTVNVNVVPVDLYYSKYYLQADLSLDYFSYLPYFAQASQTMLPGAGLNTTQWNDPEYTELYAKAQSTADDDERRKIVRQLRQIEFDRGGYIVPLRASVVDLISSRVNGLEAGANGYPLGGMAFSKMWLAN